MSCLGIKTAGRFQNPVSTSLKQVDTIATAVRAHAPDRAVTLWKKRAEYLIANIKPAAYLEAVKYLRKAAKVLCREKRLEEWEDYLRGLRLRYHQLRCSDRFWASAVERVQIALLQVPPDSYTERGAAFIYLAAALQMIGQAKQAHACHALCGSAKPVPRYGGLVLPLGIKREKPYVIRTNHQQGSTTHR